MQQHGMTRIVIVDAGIGGLASALMLGREGHEVIVCERDASAVPSDPDSMWSDWGRPGTPHARLGHTFLAGARRTLAERLPDVLEALLTAGAQQWDMASEIPASERRSDDAELVIYRRFVDEGRPPALGVHVTATPAARQTPSSHGAVRTRCSPRPRWSTCSPSMPEIRRLRRSRSNLEWNPSCTDDSSTPNPGIRRGAAGRRTRRAGHAPSTTSSSRRWITTPRCFAAFNAGTCSSTL